jgi:hypothetical protein
MMYKRRNAHKNDSEELRGRALFDRFRYDDAFGRGRSTTSARRSDRELHASSTSVSLDFVVSKS